MTDLTLPLFMKMANAYLEGDDVTLAALAAEFQKLEGEDKKLHFGQLCRRKFQASDRLIDVLFAIGKQLPCQRPITFSHLEQDWQKRGKDASLAEKMLLMLCEQFAP